MSVLNRKMFKMVFIVNTSLKMSTGKVASQTAHAAVSLYIKAKHTSKKHLIFLNEIDTWVNLGQKKVVLKGVNESQLVKLEKQACDLNLLSILIQDAGRTQITPGSLTCLGIFGKEDQMLKRLEFILRNEWPRYSILVGWLLINLITFLIVYFSYQTSLQYFYLRTIIQSGLSFSRAAAFCINLNCALLLLPICRNFISYARSFLCCPTNVVRVIDKHVTFHRYIAYTIMFFSIVHTVAHIFNVENFVNARKMTTQKFNTTLDGLISTLSLQKDGVNPVGDSNPVFESLKLVPGVTGIILCLVLSIYYSSSSELMRRSYYNLFWYSHQILAILFFIFLVTHGLQGIVKKQINLGENDPQKCYLKYVDWSEQNKECDIPKFAGSDAKSWIWVLPSVVIFLVERIVRFVRSLFKHNISQYKLHPSQVLELIIENTPPRRIHYRAGQYIYLNISQISFFEWHPFTITSAPNDSNLTVHIRCEGDWTSKLQSEIDKISLVSIDGPYGTCAEDVFKYRKVILIGAGIGVTPYSSILKHIWYRIKNSTDDKLNKIYFFWISPSIDTFEWFGVLLQELEIEMKNKSKEDLLEYKLYLTRGWSLKEAKRIANNHDDKYDLFTGLEQKTNYGRPNFEVFFKQLHDNKHDYVKEEIGVFFCGPKSLSTEIHSLCNKNSNDKIQFFYNKENF